MILARRGWCLSGGEVDGLVYEGSHTSPVHTIRIMTTTVMIMIAVVITVGDGPLLIVSQHQPIVPCGPLNLLRLLPSTQALHSLPPDHNHDRGMMVLVG